MKFIKFVYIKNKFLFFFNNNNLNIDTDKYNILYPFKYKFLLF